MTDTAIVEVEQAAAPLDLTQRLKDAILNGEFAPHQRLIEADLSERYDASRASVRTALLNLTSEGLVERVPNRGARVRAISVDEAVEIVEVRIGLETLCARKAAENLTEPDAEKLRRLRSDIEDAVHPATSSSTRGSTRTWIAASATSVTTRQRPSCSSGFARSPRATSSGSRSTRAAPASRLPSTSRSSTRCSRVTRMPQRPPTRAHLEGIVDVLRGLD